MNVFIGSFISSTTTKKCLLSAYIVCTKTMPRIMNRTFNKIDRALSSERFYYMKKFKILP